MSDFADLWTSSAPSKSIPQQPEKKLDSAPPLRRQQYDAFSILSASQPSARPVVNNQPNDRQVRPPQPTARGGDAFDSLFTSLDGAAAGRSPDQANMTMAERASLAQKARTTRNDGALTQNKPGCSSSSLWDGLDVLARPTTASPRPPASAQKNSVAEDNFDFAYNSAPAPDVVPSKASPRNDASVDSDSWGLSEFTSDSLSPPAPAKSISSQPADLWDFDNFGSSEIRTSQSQLPPPSRSLTGTPGNFDFGDREDIDSDMDDTFGVPSGRSGRSFPPGDDILGDLGKPVTLLLSPSPDPSTSTQGHARPLRTGASPPPHITGQLVEMGFSPLDARTALANTRTESGFDVQAAAELLLSHAGQEGSRPSPNSSEPPRHRDDYGGQAARRPLAARIDTQTQSPNPSQADARSQSQLDMTAEKLFSQAGEIGRGMFNKANALWREGKERAVKMYEERAAVANGASGAQASDGRPRWMRDHDHAGDEWKQQDQGRDRGAVHTAFQDDEGEGEEGEREDRQRPLGKLQTQSQPTPQPEREREINLFGADSPANIYQSPYRRGKSKPQAPSPSIQPSPPTLLPPAAASALTGPSTSRTSPPRTFTTTISLSALTTFMPHKIAGTDAYKRGDFPMALAAYLRALSALPAEHPLRVPILTNVALVRAKVGELRETIKACEEAIGIVRRFVSGAGGQGEMSFTGTEPNFDEKMPVDVGAGKVSVSVQGGDATPDGDLPTSVDLIEGLSKAFRRRAEALEGLEKWAMARSTWEALLSAEWASAAVKGEAVKSVGRCRKMVDSGGSAQDGDGPALRPAPKPKPRPSPAPQSRPKSKPTSMPETSAALDALRSNNDAQQGEDIARLACKDTVDARLTAWKNGREGNIRALLTSLDETVLWPELGWRKVGMAEVVSKGQVKGAYVRAIARVHPDKLNAGNTTVEQRMVANGVFGALNEAWNAFQQR